MIVYHGSEVSVETPDITYGRDNTDFGKGFYVTDNLVMAEKWACRRNTPYITEYLFDDIKLSKYTFKLDVEWLNFIIANRNKTDIEFDFSKYDVLIGATANDKLFSTIERYEQGLISSNMAVEILNCMKIGNQYCIRTDTGLKALHYKKSFLLTADRILKVCGQNKKDRVEANRITKDILNRNRSQNTLQTNLFSNSTNKYI